jgi:hypothetical protein
MPLDGSRRASPRQPVAVDSDFGHRPWRGSIDFVQRVLLLGRRDGV